MRSTTLLFVLLLAAAPAMAVDTLQVHPSDPVLASRRWTEFDRNSGLVGGVYDTLEDRDGNIWFATDKGVQRYDGYLWTTYTTKDGLSANQVHTLIQTQDGSMWFGTNGGGISRFDGETWTTYTMDQGLASNAMRRWGLHQTRDGTLSGPGSKARRRWRCRAALAGSTGRPGRRCRRAGQVRTCAVHRSQENRPRCGQPGTRPSQPVLHRQPVLSDHRLQGHAHC